MQGFTCVQRVCRLEGTTTNDHSGKEEGRTTARATASNDNQRESAKSTGKSKNKSREYVAVTEKSRGTGLYVRGGKGFQSFQGVQRCHPRTGWIAGLAPSSVPSTGHGRAISNS